MTPKPTRRLLFRWTGWFALANSVVFGLVSLRYFSGGLQFDNVLSAIYLVSVYVGHHVLLTTIPLFLIATPLILVFPRRRILSVLAVLLFASMIAVMMLDSMLWSQSRFHLNALTMKILGWQSWVFTGVIFVVALFFESILVRTVWDWVERPKRRYGRAIGVVCCLMIVVSQGIHAWADAAYHVPVTSLGQRLPVYKGITAKSFMTKSGFVDVDKARERGMARRMAQSLDVSAGNLLNYPLNPLQCEQEQPFNILLIVADAMRSSILTPEAAPNISRFAREEGISFRNHFSGGNSSRIGLFSLFYSLPPGYWSNFVALARSPVLLDQLQALNYQLGLFSSSTMYRPAQLDRTVFANVPDLRIVTEPESDPPWKRDRTLTREWFEWLDNRDQGRPFFGFLLYDATNRGKPPPDYPVKFQPDGDGWGEKRFARYQGSVHFVDDLIGAVLSDLKERGLLENTVVLITADHGEEFAESDEKLRSHGSGFTRHQLMTPMVVSWPGKKGGVAYDYRTSHYDIAPTIMQDLLACTNPPSDYSVGANLFETDGWDWLLVGSYYNYALVEPDQVTVTYPNGLYEVRDLNYRLLESPQFRGDVLEAASEQNARYFAK